MALFLASPLLVRSSICIRPGKQIFVMGARERSQHSVPSGAWDTHMHVTDLDRFPPAHAGKANYKPHSSTLEGAHKNATRLSVPNLAFVQPSTYGTDNSCLLWCLQQVTPRYGRGVVVIDHETIELAKLREWHESGVRGVRVNLKSIGSEPSPSELRALLKSVDSTIKPLKTWSIHIYADASYMDVLRNIVGEIESKVCIDHMGSPTKTTIGPQIRGERSWTALKDMLEDEKVFVKISAPYRFAEARDWAQLEPLVKDLLACRSGRAAIFASDWPHTRFETADIKPWVDLCLDWCGEDEKLRRNFFRDNAERLYDVKPLPH